MSRATRKPTVQPVGAWRRVFVLGVLGSLALVVFARAFQLQVLDRDFLRSEGDKRQIRTVVIPGHRGAILDRRGEPLALSAPVSSIWAVPSEVLAHPEALLQLASALGRAPSELEAFLQERSARKFVYLRENLSPADTQKVLALKVPGVFSEPSYARYYPAGEVASQVVGFAGRDGVGLEGIERAEQRRLTGTPGKRRVIRDRTGRVIEDGLDFVPAAAGETLNLTLAENRGCRVQRQGRADRDRQRAQWRDSRHCGAARLQPQQSQRPQRQRRRAQPCGDRQL
jgi:cell division protein FtsI (penicillin-binding protein 3)